ncbi:MAG: DUF1405 domain-containing protein [Halobacteriaceae archaeon]
MATPTAVLDRLTSEAGLPTPRGLPRFVAPLPTWLENLGLHLAWPIAVINLVGTAFGFWYYRFQFQMAAPIAWPLVPDSPMATLFIAASLVAWRLDYDAELIHMLAFFGCLKLGFWTPFVQLFINGQGDLATWLYWFLIGSHLAMAVQAFLIQRYARFSIPAILAATTWYWANDIVDYFVRFAGDYHHTLLRAEATAGGYTHLTTAHNLAAAAAVTLTLLATTLAFLTRRHRTRP